MSNNKIIQLPGKGQSNPTPTTAADRPRIDLSKLDNITCDSCGSHYFKMSYIVKRIPGIMVGAPSDIMQPIQVMRCDDCGQPLSETETL